MKGLVVDCVTGKIREVDNGLPMPEYSPYVEPEGLDLAEAKRKLAEIDEIKAILSDLDRRLKRLERR